METKIEIGSCRGEVMKRSELESFIMETYNAEADYPWLKYPNYEVFRHCNNRKNAQRLFYSGGKEKISKN